MTKPVQLTPAEVEALYHLLAEEAQRMDDDGREGAFDSSDLAPIYRKLRDARR